ncbi:MAG: hypothetical protein PHO92_04455, partial [Candidatus Peribacteraceae bacterium]|nr:hypothetical protein [Candidatus Peribacteraceae bacterium]
MPDTHGPDATPPSPEPGANGRARSYKDVMAHGRDDVTGGTASFKERFDSVIPAHEEHADRLDDTYESFAAG